MNITRKLFSFLVLMIFQPCHASSPPPKQLRRFWTNTGFAPIGLPAEDVLLSSDTLINIELIASLPNKALHTIRIHWLLDLIDFKNDKFDKLDAFLDVLVAAGMNLGLEFMTHNVQFDWENDTYEILRRYTVRYGINVTSQWKLETWNEPDLKSYNVLNFTLDDYLNYVQSLQNGIQRASVDFKYDFRLRGPAGLFKSKDKHPFCYKMIELCQNGGSKCPFDVITFHRKGNGTAESIFSETIALVIALSDQYPRLSQMKFSNDEADPIATWSIPRSFQADIGYATTIVKTILLHWTAIYNEIVDLESISHDNAFLSFYPNQFTQRTLLARFQINNTEPPHTQFFQKPVFGALGLMGNLGAIAFDLQHNSNWNGSDVTYLSTLGNGRHFYLATILVVKTANGTLSYKFPAFRETSSTIWFAVEGIIEGINDPFKYWKENKSPSFPKPAFRETLRKLQSPLLLQHGKKDQKTPIDIPVRQSSVILIRACEDLIPPPMKIQRIRLRKVTENEVLILWSDEFYEERCILTYQIFFQSYKDRNWEEITKDRHVPFMNFQYRAANATTGCFKIRSIDIMMQKSRFSDVECIAQ